MAAMISIDFPRPTRAAYNRTSMRWLLLMLCVVPLPGQILKVASKSAPAGKKSVVEISLESPAGKEPLSIKWEMTFPGDALKLDRTGAHPGPAAQGAGKNLTCAARKQSGQPSRWVCLLAGGRKEIPNGVIARFQFDVGPGAAGSLAVVVENADAASAALKKIPITRAEGTVTVTR